MDIQQKGKIKWKIVAIEVVHTYDVDGKNAFLSKLSKQVAQYQDCGYYTEVQFNSTNCEYMAMVIARAK